MDENAILVVEDDPNIRDIVEVALRFHGFRVTGVETGDDALTEVDRDPPALIVLDVMLPGIDGFEVCRRIRSKPELAEIPIIFLSAADEKAFIVRALEAFQFAVIEYDLSDRLPVFERPAAYCQA